MERCRRALRPVWKYRRALVVVGAPVILTVILPLKHEIGLTDKAGNCLYVLLLMACYWTTEAVDIAVTALLPLAFFPMMGVMSAETVAKQYLKDATILLIGGFFLAAAIETCGVQKRIALNMLRLMGSGERTLMMAFMLSTWFISMWISNTAASSIMITIAQSLLAELKQSADILETAQVRAMQANGNGTEMADAERPNLTEVTQSTAVNGAYTSNKESPATITISKSDATLMTSATTADILTDEEEQTAVSSDWLALGKGLSLCVAYSATIGGMATLIGSGSNIVLVQNIETVAAYHPNVTSVTFASWSVIGMPLSVILLVLCWLWLQVLFFGFRMNSNNRAASLLMKRFFTEQCKQLGKISFEEITVSLLLFVLVLLWLTRDMGDAGGWGLLFNEYVKDGTTAITVGLLLFVIPSSLDAFPCAKRRRELIEGPTSLPARTIVTWKEVQQKVPWGIVMLLGGGFALADGVTGSGLADVIGKLLASSLNGLPDWAMVMVMAAVTAVLTEVTSNVALVTLFLPIVAKTAIGVGKNPLYLMFPTCLAASFAFMLPVATPPNAIVFSTGVLTVLDMAKAGIVMNIIGIGAVTFAMTTWGSAYFRLNEWSGDAVANGSLVLLNATTVP